MNYISELNAFDNWIDTHPMSANAIGLWRALMQIANKAQWRESLAIPNALITLKSGLTTTSIKRAREELRQAGRITFDFRTGRQATIYHIIPFADQKSVQNGPQKDVAVRVAVRVADQIGPQNGPIYKHKQNKTDNAAAAACAREREVCSKMENTAHDGKAQERDPGFGETAQLYQDNVHPFSGRIEAESLGDLYDRYGQTWVNEGIRTMVKSKGRSITYLERVLERWEREGYKSQQKGRQSHDFTNGPSGSRSSDGSAGPGKVLPESIQAYADRKAARFFAELDRQEQAKSLADHSDTGRIRPAAAGTLPEL